jgi:hypothetical protein
MEAEILSKLMLVVGFAMVLKGSSCLSNKVTYCYSMVFFMSRIWEKWNGIFLIGMLIWKKCFNKPDTAESTLPAPSAPPMPASAQPQRHIKTPVTNNQANKSNASIPIHINISLKNSPKKGRDIGTIFEVTLSSLI